MNRRSTWLAGGVAACLLAACGGGSDSPPAATGASTASALAARVSGDASTQRVGGSPHRVKAPAGMTVQRLDPRLRATQGSVDVWVQLDQNSVAAQRASLASTAGLQRAMKSSPQLRQGISVHLDRIREAQSALSGRAAALGARELARVKTAHNAIAMRVDASKLDALAALPGVAKVRPVLRYELALSETVPYVGGTTVQKSGIDGTGVTVAVLDSGIDYTHRNLGGPGTTEAYAAAYGAGNADPKNTTLDGLFPTAKVVAGYDFVGEAWPNADLAPDSDPIDFEGHGTHVADIIGGKSNDGTHVGMAPGAKLVAVKVCSAVSSSCSGVALLQGMDFALDPNGDGDTEDAVDVINMSLGSNYGQIEDDLTLAATNAVNLGVMVVTSAGNGGNKPYIVGSPSIAPGVLSVAQTQTPSATAIPLVVNAPAAIAGVYGNTATVDFAPIGAGITDDVVFVGRGCPAGSVAPGAPEDPYAVPPAGKIALIDRGGCSVSLKVDRAAKAGATGVLIGLVAPGDAVSFSFGGGDTFVPTLVIQQVVSTSIKGQLTAGENVNASLSPASGIPLVGSMVSSSSRGPSIPRQSIKPEIGAPGASVSAEAGTGNGETAFGGTSGAAPMVAGAAALLLQALPNEAPARIKAMLMNSAETTIYTNPALAAGDLAPITRVGAGELRVDRAIALTSTAWNVSDQSAALSFGALNVAAPVTVKRTLRIANHATTAKSFSVTPTFRFADDKASGAVTVKVNSTASVPAQGFEDLDVSLTIDPSKLPTWTLNGGSLGGDGGALNKPEYDGLITLVSGSEKLVVPWHVLPRKASRTSAKLASGGGSLSLANAGTEGGDYDVFSLIGQSPLLPWSDRPQPGDNFALIDLRAMGVRHLPKADFGEDFLEFAISTWGRRAQPNYPAEFDVYLDTTGDGEPDYVVFNTENGGFAVTGQSVVAVADLAAPAGTPASVYFFTDADFNSGNVIMTVPLSALKLEPGKTIGISVYAFDNYFSGNQTDAIEGLRFTPALERYGVPGLPFGSVAAKGSTSLDVSTARVPRTASTESGLLLMYRRNAGLEADAIRVR